MKGLFCAMFINDIKLTKTHWNTHCNHNLNYEKIKLLFIITIENCDRKFVLFSEKRNTRSFVFMQRADWLLVRERSRRDFVNVIVNCIIPFSFLKLNVIKRESEFVCL